MPARVRPRLAFALSALLLLQGCGVGNFFLGGSPTPSAPAHIAGFIGGVAADEPQAALIARDVLARGGDAADAAVALGFALSVTLPSRASLGAGGACLAYAPPRNGPGDGVPEAILFVPRGPSAAPAGSDRPAAVPMLARGLFLLQARYGHLPFEQLLAPSEQLATFGTPVSRALATDLSLVATPLLADPNAARVFGNGHGGVLGQGQQLVQLDLGATLSRLRTAGVGDFYQGGLARAFVAAANAAGGGASLAAQSASVPTTAPPILLPAGRDQVAFLPPPADGGLGAAAAFQTLRANPAALEQAATRAAAIVAAWRVRHPGGGGPDPQALLAASLPPASLPPLPASTAFAVVDRNGQAVSCAVTMDNLFGTGRVAPGTGIVLAAAPTSQPRPLLAAAIAWNAHLHAFRAAVAGSGQNGAALAVGEGMANALAGASAMPVPVADPGRAVAIACPRYLPGDRGACNWATDPRGAGLAIGTQ